MKEYVAFGFYSEEHPDPRFKACVPREQFERCVTLLGVEPVDHFANYKGQPGKEVDEVLDILRSVGIDVVLRYDEGDPKRTILLSHVLKFEEEDIEQTELLAVSGVEERFERVHCSSLEKGEIAGTAVQEDVDLGRDNVDQHTLFCSDRAKASFATSGLAGIEFHPVITRGESKTWRLAATSAMPPVSDGYWTSRWNESEQAHGDGAPLWVEDYPEKGACFPGVKWEVPVYRFDRGKLRLGSADLFRSTEEFGWPFLRSPVMVCSQRFRAYCNANGWKLYYEPALIVD